MPTYKKFLIGLISLLLFMALNSLFSFTSIDRTILNRDFYTQFVKNTDIVNVLYSEGKANLEQAILEDIDEEDEKAEEILTLLFETLDDDYIEEQILNISDQVFEFIYEDGKGQIKIDITEKREDFEQKVISFAIDEGMDEQEANELATEVLSEIGIFDEAIEFDLEDINELVFVRNNISLFKILIYISILTSILMLSLFMFFLVKDKISLKYLSIIYLVASLLYILSIVTTINVSIPLILEYLELSEEFFKSTMFILNRVLLMPMIFILISMILFVTYIKMPEKKE